MKKNKSGNGIRALGVASRLSSQKRPFWGVLEQNLKRSEEQGTQIFRGSASQAKILGWERGRHVSVLVRRPVWLQQGGNEQDMKLGGGPDLQGPGGITRTGSSPVSCWVDRLEFICLNWPGTNIQISLNSQMEMSCPGEMASGWDNQGRFYGGDESEAGSWMIGRIWGREGGHTRWHK